MTEQLLERTDSLTDKSLALAESMLGETIRLRAEFAAEQSDFLPTPELQKGLEGYYQDHYALAGLIDRSLDPHAADEAYNDTLQEIIDASYLSPDEISESIDLITTSGTVEYLHTAQELLPLIASIDLSLHRNPDNPDLQKTQLKLLRRAVQMLFAERSVGVTTVGDKEKDLVVLLTEKLNKAIESSGLSESVDALQPEHTLAGIEEAQEGFWEDCRFAGQLLFHNTGDFDSLRSSGEIMTRRMQQKVRGETRAQTAEARSGHIHSPTVHWSEHFDPSTYRGGWQSETGGTIAVPLERIIEFSPFARDAEYGALTLKPETEKEIIPKITINDDVGYIGAGQEDGQGPTGLDRTFYASPHDVPSNAPLEEAPDGYSIPIDEQATSVQLGKRDISRESTYGYGEQWPQNYSIQVETARPDGLSTDEIMQWLKERDKKIAQEIQTLQHKSIASRPGRIVVPLRSGVMDFYVPDDNTSRVKRRAQFTSVA